MTSILKASRRFVLFAAMALGLAAAGDAAAVTAGGVTIDVIATQSWQGGFNGAVRITNNSFPAAITSFQAVFKLNGTAGIQGNGWHGTISNPDASGNRTVRNASWMGSLGAGRSWDEGLSGTGTFSGATFVSLTVNGQNIPLGGGDPGDTTPPSVSLASSATSVTQASTITLTATASDASGIARVEFFEGASATPICTDTTAPYTCGVALTAAHNGTRVYTARATDGASPANSAVSAAVNVSVNIQQQTTEFALSAPAAASVTRGASTQATISITRTNFTAAVAFSVSGLPSGVSASFSPSSTTANSTVLTLTASTTATTGTFPVTVTGSANGLTRTASLSLTVSPATTSTFALSAPASASVSQGANATAAITITRTNFTAAIALTASGLPAGVSASFNPASATGTSSVLTFAATSSATTGTFPVTVTGTANGITRTVSISLTVSPVTTSNFALSAAPATLTVNRGASGTSTISITRTNLTAAIALTATGLPAGVTATFNPASVTGTSSIVTFAASSTAAAAGPVNVTITGTANGLSRTTTVALTVRTTTTCTGTNCGNFAVVNGRVTKDGQHYPVRCGSWFGLQGRYEPAYDAQNPRGAPMEQYVGNTFWAATHTRTVMQTMNEIKQAGITVIRLPVVHQTLNPTDKQGDGSLYKNHSSIINDPTYPMRNARESMESMIKAANSVGIAVMLDIHSCSNYIDWRKGRLDARPPWTDATRDDYDFMREEYSCADTLNPPSVRFTHPYNETIWLEDLRTLAGLPAKLGVTNIIGIDIFNEPHDYSWTEWKTLTEHAYQAISAVNPNLLLFVQGIGTEYGKQDGTPDTQTPVPHGDAFSNPNWGENLYPAGTDLPNVPVSKLVWSPHTYGPSVFVQSMFMDPAQPQCTGLSGDAAGDAKCNIVINAPLLRQGWEEHFGYLKDLGYAMVVGEFGGNMDWPLGTASTRDRNRFGYLTDKTVDAKWQNAFVDYMVERGIEGCYWSINPESGDTGGWYGHAYDPISNTGGWGEWRPFDTRKTTLLNRHWSGVP